MLHLLREVAHHQEVGLTDLRGLYRAALATGLTLVAVFGLSIASASPAAAATTHHVTLSNFTYCVEGNCNNHTLTISPGDTVVWTYADSVCDLTLVCLGHTATSTGGPSAFNSPTMHTPGALTGNTPTTYGLSFFSSGTYTYTCAFHGSGASNGLLHMDGAIVVQAAAIQRTLNSRPVVITPPGSGSGSASGAPPGTISSLPVVITPPGSGSGSTSGAPNDRLDLRRFLLPIGPNFSVSANELPNTLLPSLPSTGRGLSPRSWMLLEVAASLGIVSAALLALRLATRRRSA